MNVVNRIIFYFKCKCIHVFCTPVSTFHPPVNREEGQHASERDLEGGGSEEASQKRDGRSTRQAGTNAKVGWAQPKHSLTEYLQSATV